MTRMLHLVKSVSLILCLVGCSPLGGPTSWIPKTVASFGGGDKSPGWGVFFRDWEARRSLVKKLDTVMPQISKSIDVHVMDQKILLVGVVKQKAMHAQMLKVVKDSNPGCAVIDKTILSESYPWKVRMHDIVIEKEIEGKLLFSSIPSYNYGVVVFCGNVQILGVARSEEELRRVEAVAQATSGVKSVKSFVRVVGSGPEMQQKQVLGVSDAIRERRDGYRKEEPSKKAVLRKEDSDALGLKAAIRARRQAPALPKSEKVVEEKALPSFIPNCDQGEVTEIIEIDDE